MNCVSCEYLGRFKEGPNRYYMNLLKDPTVLCGQCFNAVLYLSGRRFYKTYRGDLERYVRSICLECREMQCVPKGGFNGCWGYLDLAYRVVVCPRCKGKYRKEAKSAVKLT